MIVMEGVMMVPPERGTIIGRALWKSRYVVLGTGAFLRTQNDLMSNPESQRNSRKSLKSPSLRPSLLDLTLLQHDKLYLSIYKAKGDWEYLAQHPISAFKTCEIQPIQHRKQGPALPTMILEMKPDAASEKLRNRRSSRTGGLTKDPWGSTLLFRSVPEERYNIYDWQITLNPQLTPDSPYLTDEILSPISPSPFNSFTNPFASRDSRTQSISMPRPEIQQRPSNQNVSTYPHAPREARPSALISPSPSLRSRGSDVSSQSSTLQPPMGFTSSHPQCFTTTLPSDMPSPASTSGYDSQFIEGWTSAQGRSSTLSSHTRGSNSTASAAAPAAQMASSPPGQRETILDRAFQMRYIPGSERVQDNDDENISSIARFDALMREVDERRIQNSISSVQDEPQQPDWDLDEDSEIFFRGEVDEDDDEADALDMSDEENEMPTPAQRALDYISGRRAPLTSTLRPLSPTSKSPPIPFLNQQAMSAFHGYALPPSDNGGGLRPRTGTTPSKQRKSRPNSLALASRSTSTTAVNDTSVYSGTGVHVGLTAGAKADRQEKRRSSTSMKRLSFTEFAKRLSSTSSLLLVQTNASSSSGRDGSRRGSSEYGADGEDRGGLRSGVNLKSSAMATANEREAREKRCGWRGSVGVFGGEGGFL